MNAKGGTDWRLLRRVLATAKPFKSLFIQSILLAIIITPFSIAQPFIVQKIVDENIIGGQKSGLLWMSIIFIVVLLINVVMKYYFIYITAELGQSVIKDMRVKVFRHITNLRLRYFDQEHRSNASTGPSMISKL